MRIISTAETRQLLGTEADRLDGMSVGQQSNSGHCRISDDLLLRLQWFAYDPKQL